eukprot:13308577-Alexandrium_andersonii.AAC.1
MPAPATPAVAPPVVAPTAPVVARLVPRRAPPAVLRQPVQRLPRLALLPAEVAASPTPSPTWGALSGPDGQAARGLGAEPPGDFR